MAKGSNMRERVHQPFRDTLVRTSGWYASDLQDVTDLFIRAGKPEGESNLKQGSVLPSDQSLVILMLRVLLHFVIPVRRSAASFSGADIMGQNGDWFVAADGTHDVAAQNILHGNVVGDYHDVYRLYHQASEQLFWEFGAGEKPSLRSMPSSYFPWGGGLCGDVGGCTDLLYFTNGDPGHVSGLRLGRAITLPPRQNITCKATIQRLPNTNSNVFGTNQGSRDMMNLRDNLNAVDGVPKTVAAAVDGLFSREVQ
jgi:hypothetical protein